MNLYFTTVTIKHVLFLYGEMHEKMSPRLFARNFIAVCRTRRACLQQCFRDSCQFSDKVNSYLVEEGNKYQDVFLKSLLKCKNSFYARRFYSLLYIVCRFNEL